MKKAALAALIAGALAIGGCGTAIESAPGAAPGASQANEPTVNETQYTSDGMELSPSDQAGLEEAQCTLDKALAGKSPEEQQRISDEIVNEIVASEENISVADVLAERGITC